jgi:hypothetical protein
MLWSGGKDIGDGTRSTEAAMAATTATKDKVDGLTRDGCHITSELRATTAIGKLAVMAIIREPDCKKVCTRWVMKMLTVEQKTDRKYSVQNFSSVVRQTRCFSSKNVCQ